MARREAAAFGVPSNTDRKNYGVGVKDEWDGNCRTYDNCSGKAATLRRQRQAVQKKRLVEQRVDGFSSAGLKNAKFPVKTSYTKKCAK